MSCSISRPSDLCQGDVDGLTAGETCLLARLSTSDHCIDTWFPSDRPKHKLSECESKCRVPSGRSYAVVERTPSEASCRCANEDDLEEMLALAARLPPPVGSGSLEIVRWNGTQMPGAHALEKKVVQSDSVTFSVEEGVPTEVNTAMDAAHNFYSFQGETRPLRAHR